MDYVNDIDVFKAIQSDSFLVFGIKFAQILDFLLSAKFDNTIINTNGDNKDFLFGCNNVFVLMVKPNFIVLQVEILDLKNSINSKDIKSFLITICQYLKVFLIFKINITGLVYQ